jgi:sterol desaturase/sphingolipid hydroxylase (fatty acid hydroxylase superfamily)
METTEKAVKKPQNTGSPQLFKNPILEKLSRTHISLPLGIFFSVSAWLLVKGVQETGLQGWQIGLSYAIGLVAFTWLEYNAHRYIYHMKPTTPWKQEIQYKFHGVHHDYPKDKGRLALPPLVSLAVTTVLFFAFKLVMGDFVFGFLPGFLTGYAAYLGVHYMVHAYRPPKNFFKVLWINHGIHHYKQSDRAYGVSSPLWDYVYRTMPDRN